MFIISMKKCGIVSNNYPTKIREEPKFFCKQKAYKHKVLFPMSEGSIALVKFSLSYKPDHPTIHLELSGNISVPLRLHSPSPSDT